jgi:hypothetical protein
LSSAFVARIKTVEERKKGEDTYHPTGVDVSIVENGIGQKRESGWEAQLPEASAVEF